MMYCKSAQNLEMYLDGPYFHPETTTPSSMRLILRLLKADLGTLTLATVYCKWLVSLNLTLHTFGVIVLSMGILST